VWERLYSMIGAMEMIFDCLKILSVAFTIAGAIAVVLVLLHLLAQAARGLFMRLRDRLQFT
jgi:hypothetical protein